MENNLADHFSHIKGWGVDADPKNEPTYPMKKYTGDDHRRLNYPRPPQQPVTVEVLHSNERPSVTAVFGTSCPPAGVSGAVRRYAFKYSEGSFGHWIPLLLADRIDVVQGIVNDLKQGHVPNIFAEKGLKAEWKYNKKGLAKKLLTAIVTTAAVVALLSRKNKWQKE